MSGCANVGQALGRGLKLHTSRSSYTLPFLYQTPTLRRYYSALQDLAKENASKTAPNIRLRNPPREPTPTTPTREKEPEYEEYVPFETPGAAESAVVQNTIQGESLTGTERNAFAQLEALANAPTRPATKTKRPPQENSFISLDDVLNEAITAIEANEDKEQKPFYAYGKQEPERSEFDTLSLVTAPAIEEPDQTDRVRAEEVKLAHENTRAIKALQQAKTDTKVWNILETYIFSQVARLHLDSPAPPSTTISPARRRFILKVFPLRLVSAASLLRNNFPNSNLILAILPRIKELGPAAYALATSPDLYNQLLAFHFRKFADVDACNHLLQEMDDNSVEPAASTLRVLDYILNFRNDCIEKGNLGAVVKSLFTTEKYRREFAIMEKWRAKIEQNLAEQQSRLQRKANNDEMRVKEDQGRHDQEGPIRYISTLDTDERQERLQIREELGKRAAESYKYNKLAE